jgi:hypothetical protein
MTINKKQIVFFVSISLVILLFFSGTNLVAAERIGLGVLVGYSFVTNTGEITLDPRNNFKNLSLNLHYGAYGRIHCVPWVNFGFEAKFYQMQVERSGFIYSRGSYSETIRDHFLVILFSYWADFKNGSYFQCALGSRSSYKFGFGHRAPFHFIGKNNFNCGLFFERIVTAEYHLNAYCFNLMTALEI